MDAGTLADLGTGVAVLGAGAIAWTQRRARATGTLLMATGAAWLAGSAVDELVFLYPWAALPPPVVVRAHPR